MPLGRKTVPKRQKLKQSAYRSLSNSSSKQTFKFSTSERFQSKSHGKGKRQRKSYDFNNFMTNASLYTPAPGAYQVGSIFGQASRFKRRRIDGEFQGLKKLKDLNLKRKYEKKSFKDFNYEILMGKKKWEKGDLKDQNGKYLSYGSKRYRTAGYISGPIIRQGGTGFGKGNKDRFYKPDQVKTRIQSRKPGKMRTLPGPGNYVQYSDFAYYDTPAYYRSQKRMKKNLEKIGTREVKIWEGLYDKKNDKK